MGMRRVLGMAMRREREGAVVFACFLSGFESSVWLGCMTLDKGDHLELHCSCLRLIDGCLSLIFLSCFSLFLSSFSFSSSFLSLSVSVSLTLFAYSASSLSV